LAELLGANLEVLMTIKVLEEALSIESLAHNDFLKSGNNMFDTLFVTLACSLAAINTNGSSIIECDINILLQTLLSENFIDNIAEFSPLDVITGLRGTESLEKQIELGGRDDTFGHVETNTELASGNVTRSKFVEVTEEFSNTDALLRAFLTDRGNNIIDIIRLILNDVLLSGLGLRLREVVEGVVEVTANTEHLLRAVDFVAEINIVNLISVTLVHISLQQHVGDVIRSLNTQLAQDTQELLLGDMTVASDIKILELRLEVDSSIIYSGSVFVKDLVDEHIVTVVTIEVLSASENGIIGGHGSNFDSWGLVNTLGGESEVHVISESGIVEESLGVIGLVLGGEVVELVVSHGEVHHGEDLFELVLGDTTLTELVKVSEELFNTHSLHNNGGLKALLNITRVIGSFDSLLLEAV